MTSQHEINSIRVKCSWLPLKINNNQQLEPFYKLINAHIER